MQEYTFPEYKDWCLRSIAYVVSFGLFILGLGGGVLAQTDASFLANYSIDSNLTTVILALIAAVVTPVVTFVLKYVQDRNIAISSKERFKRAKRYSCKTRKQWTGSLRRYMSW